MLCTLNVETYFELLILQNGIVCQYVSIVDDVQDFLLRLKFPDYHNEVLLK